MTYGDHCVYFHGAEAPLVRASSLERLRSRLREVQARGTRVLLIPHHVGYRAGWRGIDWDAFTAELSPVVEMVSMHGCAESGDGPRPYLHTMGPRDSGSSMWEGLRRGYLFGVVGSSDHHSAHPGSHGHGRLAVWAPELTRTEIWDAIERRRTYALTGDRIELRVALNGNPMGASVGATDTREIGVDVVAGGSLDYVEVVRNGRPVHRRSAHEITVPESPEFQGRVELRVGWGRKDEEIGWDLEFGVENGTVTGLEPRFRGDDVVSPLGAGGDVYQYSRWERLSPDRIGFRSRTRGNPTSVTDATQGFALEIRGNDDTRVIARINGQEVRYPLRELRTGSRSGYIGGFVSGGYRFERAIPRPEYAWSTRFVDRRASESRDWYSVRVRQQNDQWAWSSPIWVGRHG